MYLTYSEFKSILSDSVDEVTFDKLLVRAEIQIDTVTNYFYSMPGINDIESDSISKYPWLKARSDVFKKALALTIDYMNSNNVSNSADLKNNSFSSIEIVRTTLQSANKDISNTSSGLAVPDEALMILGPYGLRYGGVQSV
ncbi:hypothetical protein [Leuconostoc citreum]|uniref:hypothetical protein n=1 Tax=Leuconostoc citreum TaxID=33964 RepID=UPI001C1FE058|nr:hypothetical protein [Leuconostoc citreum]MBU7450020.1 hypothetical protein [Leuconostoc citreum]